MSVARQDQQQKGITPGAWRLHQYLPLLSGKKVGLVVNQTSRVGSEHLVDTLIGLDVEIKRIFSPEHGFRGTADRGTTIEDTVDPATGLNIISLYGSTRKPLPEHLIGLDIMVFDIQDVGVRFFTYISTLHYVMEACAEADLPVIVLDRPNPNGYYIDGPVREPAFRSFVGLHPIPVVYGMTIGELARMINGEGWLAAGIKAKLTVIPCQGYQHGMTEPIPIAPSPSLPNHRSVLLYPSLCFFEGTSVSVGRGTETPFQILGYPDQDMGPYTFIPKPTTGARHPLHEGVKLFGLNLTDLTTSEIKEWRSLHLQWLIEFHNRLNESGEFYTDTTFFDKLAGTASLRHMLDAGIPEDKIRGSWQGDIDAFRKRRSLYLLYPDFPRQ